MVRRTVRVQGTGAWVDTEDKVENQSPGFAAGVFHVEERGFDLSKEFRVVIPA